MRWSRAGRASSPSAPTPGIEPGERSRDWLKLKIEFRQEFVVGGFTEPRNTRQHIGALLLGYFDGDRLIYVGHTGGGFTARDWRRCTAASSRSSEDVTVREDSEDEREAHWVEPGSSSK